MDSLYKPNGLRGKGHGGPDSSRYRVLVVDDQELIHSTFRAFFGGSRGSTGSRCDLDYAVQGEQGLELAQRAVWEGRPYTLAFIDMHLPPGWDGVETIARLWEILPDLQVVLCTASVQDAWEEINRRLGPTDRLIILKKPFDQVEVLQCASALTEKWRLGRELQLHLHTLEQRVQERTEALERSNAQLLAANRELATARDTAESANRAKTEFLANMSHEIRTPITAIMGYAGLMLDPGQSPDDVRPHLRTIHRNAEHLLAIISDILDISKIEAGKMSVERVPCSPRSIAEDVMALMRIRADEKQLSLVLEQIGPVAETIESDPTRLRQILMNLVGNAIKFTEAGEVRLVLSAGTAFGRPATVGGRQICFEVRDTGIGIPKDKLKSLFQMFEQADSSTSRKYGGTGLGLAITRRFVQMLRGEVHVESTPGHGSTFRVVFPTGPADAESHPGTGDVGTRSAASPECGPASATAGTGEPVPAGLPLHGRRVLVAEDSPDLQRLTRFVLAKGGAEVMIAENGQLAAELALQALRTDRPFDVILMDMQMPVMDGYSATRHLREQGYAGPIVALSAHATCDDQNRCRDAGCTHHASKPISRDDLLELVARFCEAPCVEV